MNLELREVVNLAAAGVLAVLATFLLVRKGRNRVTASMATFSLGLAGLYVVQAALRAIGPSDLYLVVLLMGVAIVAGFLGLTWSVEPERGRLSKRQLWGVWSLAAPVSVLPYFAAPEGFLGDAFATREARVMYLVGESLLNFAFYGAAFFMAQRGLARDMPRQGARSLALLAVGLTLFAAGTAAAWVGDYARSALFAIPQLAAAVAMGLFWLRPRHHPHQRLGITTGLTILAVWMLATFAEQRFPGTAFPIGRVLGTGLMVYAVLRGEIVGIDAKVRFTLSKTTVAAVFVGVFFAASELAQQFFGDRSGNEYYGIAAAGLLVIAISPLQRLADRLAQRAIPMSPTAPTGNEAAYLAGLRAAARDGRITRREERHLAEMAEHLKIGPRRALELRESVEAEAKS